MPSADPSHYRRIIAGDAARRAVEELLVLTVQSLLEHEDVFDESVLGYERSTARH